MATQVITDGVTLSAASWANDVDTATYAALTSVSGTNTVTATGPANFSYATGAQVRFVPAATNTGAVTLNITPSGGAALGAKNIFSGGAALIDGEIVSGVPVTVVYDGTQFNLTGSGSLVTFGSRYWREPLNVNPNWLVDQINEGALYTYSAASAVGPDGWTGSATGAGVFKLRTLADPDNAALKCLEITCTTADASIAATDNYYIKTAIEGYDVAGLSAGTASAGYITIRFKAKSNSVTGVFGIAVQNSAADRRYIGTFTVPDTAENEYTITLQLDTTGTWLYTNGIGLQVIITLAAGSNFHGTAAVGCGRRANHFLSGEFHVCEHEHSLPKAHPHPPRTRRRPVCAAELPARAGEGAEVLLENLSPRNGCCPEQRGNF
jgi:hypothetical protein